MTLDRVLAVITLVALTAFLGTLAGLVREFDLTVFLALGVGLAGYDFWRQLRRTGRNGPPAG
jgi:hypothetical protein